MRKLKGLILGLAMFAGAAGASVAPAAAQEVRFARQFSMGYLQFNVMEKRKLLEKHAAAAGLKDVKVVWATFNSPAAMNDALLSGSVDIVSGGVPGLLTIWARTKGTPIAVKGITAFSSQPVLLNGRDPAIKAIGDFKADHKIAVPAPKVSLQAMILQMAAAKQWGKDQYAKLDGLTVGMTPPDATIAILADNPSITAVFSVPPFQQQQLASKKVHTILNSYDVFGGPHTFTVAWTSTQFRDKNPALYKALVAAFAEATELLNKDATEAAAGWIENVRSKLPLATVKAIATGPQVRWTMTPESTMKFAEFMGGVGSIKVVPADWKELFFPEIHHLKGS